MVSTQRRYDRLRNPAQIIPASCSIRLGSNDSAGGAYFEDNMRFVEYAISQGIIPVLATKPDRFEGP